MSDRDLEDSVLDEIFRRSILPAYFPGGSRSSESPTLILLAGQHGAGRSRMSSQLMAEHGPDLAVINAEELRAFHPRFVEAARSRARDDREGLARVTAGWVRDFIRYARENRLSLVLEGPFQDRRIQAVIATGLI